MPAMMPADSCAEPSCGDTAEVSCAWNVSGSEPYLRMVASWPAWPWVKPPVPPPLISPLVVIWPWTCGA